MGKEQTKVYFSDYCDAPHKFKGAYMASIARSYWEVIDWVRDGANRAIDCEYIYRRSPPISESLITRENHKVIKLAKFTLIIIGTLIST